MQIRTRNIKPMQNHLLLSEEIMTMKKNWKKLFSVLLLAALLCALPGTMAWAEGGSTDESSGPAESQTGGTGSGTTSDTGTTGSGTSPEGTGTPGGDTGGAGSGTSPEGTGTPGGDTGGAGSSTTTGSGTTSDSSTSGTSGTQGSSGSDLPTVIVENGGTTSIPDAPTTAPEATATTTPTPTPTPTATPTPTPSLPAITKDPTDETVDVGGDCWFIAYCSNAPYAVWHFVSPDGKTNYRYDAQEIQTAFPGLQIENGDQSTLHLVKIPAEMNGWRACCEFRNDSGKSVTSGYAVVHVNGAPAATPTPSPSATPTATPSPTPTPAATATPAPSSSPAVTPSPVLSPTPEGTGEPPAALNRGGKIFLLFGAAALVVGAAAIGTILTVSKRMSAKEAYTYKNSSRRRK